MMRMLDIFPGDNNSNVRDVQFEEHDPDRTAPMWRRKKKRHKFLETIKLAEFYPDKNLGYFQDTRKIITRTKEPISFVRKQLACKNAPSDRPHYRTVRAIYVGKAWIQKADSCQMCGDVPNMDEISCSVCSHSLIVRQYMHPTYDAQRRIDEWVEDYVRMPIGEDRQVRIKTFGYRGQLTEAAKYAQRARHENRRFMNRHGYGRNKARPEYWNCAILERYEHPKPVWSKQFQQRIQDPYPQQQRNIWEHGYGYRHNNFTQAYQALALEEPEFKPKPYKKRMRTWGGQCIIRAFPWLSGGETCPATQRL